MYPETEGWGIVRRKFITGGAVVFLGSIAGCNSLGGSKHQAPAPPVEYVPESASLVVAVDMTVAPSDQARRLVEAYADDGNPTFFEKFETRTGLDVERTRLVVGFSEQANPPRTVFVVDAGYDETAAVSAIETAQETAYERTDAESGVVYRPTDGDSDVIGTAAPGQFVYGTEAEVLAALAVFDGSAPAVGDSFTSLLGTVATGVDEPDNQTITDADDSAYTDAGSKDYLAAATDRPRAYLPDEDSEKIPTGVSLDLYEKVEAAGATSYVLDGEVGVEVELRAPSKVVAGEVEDFSGTLLTFAQSRIGNQTVANELGRVSVGREKTLVTLEYQSDVEGAAVLVDWL